MSGSPENSTGAPDRLSKERRSANMRAVRAADTKPEMIVRRIAHGMGYRYRLHGRDLPGRPDLVFRPRRKVVFVHGCFWHGHRDCRRSRRPKGNADFWNAKLQRNMDRDAAQIEALENAGWRVLVIWECQTKSPAEVAALLRSFLA